MIPIEKINEISGYIKRHRAVSNFEIAYLAVDGSVEGGLTNGKVKKETVKFFMQIFLNNPPPVLPHLPCKIDFREERFCYYPYKPPVSCLIESYDRLTKIKSEASIKIIIKFLSDAGYAAVAINNDEILAIKDEQGIKIKIYGSIEDIRMNVDCDIKKYDILTLPSGSTLQPFMDFYKEYADGIVKLGGAVWNVDNWSGEVSPFIGIPEPGMMREFEGHFGKPQLASAINQLWPADEYETPAGFKTDNDNVSIKIGKIKFE
jgi:hypothetical protein